MTNDEHDLITQFIGRVSGAQVAGQPAGGSVPATVQPALPPVDPEADRLIRDLFQRYPETSYRITQLAFVQEHALSEAQNRIQGLEWELQQAKQAAQAAQQQAPQPAGPAGGGGFFGGLFGGSRPQAAPPPQPGPGPAWNQGAPMPPPPQPQWQQAAPPPQYAPNYQPGMFQRGGGSGFLGSALTTAAGVAGGMVAGNALMNLFSGHQGIGGSPGFGGGAPFGANPWGGAAPPAADYVDQGTWDNAGGAPAGGQDFVDNGTWDQPADPSTDTSWNDADGSDPGFDSGGGSDDPSSSLC